MHVNKTVEDIKIFICETWWALLILATAILSAFFTRDLWMPALFPVPTIIPTIVQQFIPTKTPMPTYTKIPTKTPEPTATRTKTPTITTSPTPAAGDVQVMLMWNNLNDLDLHVVDPKNFEISYINTNSPSNGVLQIDNNKNCVTNISKSPIENIYWPSGKAPRGKFKVYVNLYKICGNTPAETNYKVALLVDGKKKEYNGKVSIEKKKILVAEFNR